LILLHYFR